MSVCRACGQDHTLNGAPFGSFQDHARTYFDLTSIQLHEHEDPNMLELCSDCVDKLSEFDRFRDVCLQVHYGLQVKNEPEHDVLEQEEEGNSTDDEEILGGEEPQELEDDSELGFEEVNIDEKWADFKPDPDLVTNDCQQSSPVLALAIDPNTSAAVVGCTVDGSGTEPEPQYFNTSSLAELLQSSLVGRQIFERGSLGPLSNESRNELVGIIIDRHYEMRLPTIEEVLRQYAQAITGLFRHELEETYFLVRSGGRKNHSGKLYNRISNTRKKKANYLKFIETISENFPETVGVVPKPNAKSHFLSVESLKNLLQSTMAGRSLLSNASAGPLSRGSRYELVTIIVNRHFELKFPTKQAVLEQYAQAITGVFTDETKETYFIARDGTRRNHSGKLYNRISNMRQKSYKRKLYEEQHLEKVSQGTQSSKKVAISAASVNFDLPLFWLEVNAEPWDTAVEFWTRSFARRRLELVNAKTAPELVEKYRHLYSKKRGYHLVSLGVLMRGLEYPVSSVVTTFEELLSQIEMDFRQLAIGDSEGLRKWSLILPTLVAYLSRPYQDAMSKAIAEHLSSCGPSQDSVICGVLMLLNHELQPTKVMKNFKPSIRTAQQDVVLFGESDEQVQAKLIDRETMYALYDLPLAPVLVFRGKDFRTLTGSFEVHYKGIVYRFDSAARAIDVLVKLSTVFRLEYSRICRRVWLFVCSFIYELPVAEQYESINKLKRLLAPCLPVC